MCSRSSGYSNGAYCNMYDNEASEHDSFFMYQCNNETFVDDMSVYECAGAGGGREQPLGASGGLRTPESRASTPSSTPRKSQHHRRQRSFSAPRNAPTSTTMSVLAPMVAQARCPTIRRSRSAVFAKESEDRRASLCDVGQRGHPSRRTISVGQNQGYRVRPSHDPPPSASFYDLRRQNLAVIPPSTRPLLQPSPPITSYSPAKPDSWTTSALPRPSSSANTLWLSGLFLLFTSTINCVLCFYLLAKLGLQKGRHYYIDFAVISGFAMLVLGFMGLRMGRWQWVMNRNYLAGYMILSMLDVLLCAVLGLLASDWRPPDLPEVVEIASGAVCGLSALMVLLALCLGAASCCHTPPPDNRVSHNVPSFIV